MSDATIIIEGLAGKTPTLMFTKGGSEFVQFSVAVNEVVVAADGSKEKGRTTWYEVIAWSALARALADAVRTGTVLLVVGRFRQVDWVGNEGDARQKLTISAEHVGLVPKFKPVGVRTIRDDQQAEPF